MKGAPSADELVREAWGGFAATLVALPSSIAFGVLIFAPLGPSWAGAGALAGIVGNVALGIVAPVFGGTPGLVSSPSAPAAAVMSALAATLMARGSLAAPEALVLLTLVGFASASLQIVYGAVGAGRLIKYIPYPVASGYLSAVGFQIILGQLPKFFAWPKGTALLAGLASPSAWQTPAVVVGAVTMAAMLIAPKLTRKVPAPVLSVAAGVLAYFALAHFRPELALLDGNSLLIGRIPKGEGSLLSQFAERWAALRKVEFRELELLATPAAVLSVLLSIDTLKTSVQIDAMTLTRHDSNRELFGQGLGNLSSALAGGVPGSGGTGVTLVNYASGGRTRLSSALVGAFALAAALLFAQAIAWLPIAALAGILLIVGWRMLDRNSLRLATHHSTVLDFCVVAAVVATALATDLMLAAGVGLLLSFLLFIRDQIRSSVIRSKKYGNRISSKQRRLPEELEVLEKHGAETVVCELQGSLFFGTTDQLLTELEPDLRGRKFIILDMKRVLSVDFTAARLLEQIESRLTNRGGRLLFSGVPTNLPTGMDLRAYFAELGIVKAGELQLFDETSDALEWTEDRILEEHHALQLASGPPVKLHEIDMFREFRPDELAALKECMEERSVPAGKNVFSFGETGDELFFVRRGAVRIVLPLAHGESHHVATYRRRDFFGEVAFLDHGTRTANAVAVTPVDLFVLSRARFNASAPKHPDLGRHVFYRLAQSLALRLRRTDREVQALQQS